MKCMKSLLDSACRLQPKRPTRTYLPLSSQTVPRLVAVALVALMIGAAGLTGCAQGDAPADDSNSVTEPDADDQPDADHQPDADDQPDADVDDQPDTDGPPPPQTSIVAPSSGGARLETPKHQIRLIVGPRGSGAALDTPDHRIRMGAGSVQHGQRSE